MRFFLLLLPFQLFSLTWDEWEAYQEYRIQTIQGVFEQALYDRQVSNAALLLLDPFCLGVVFSDSELDFALIIPENQDVSRFLHLYKHFIALSILAKLPWTFRCHNNTPLLGSPKYLFNLWRNRSLCLYQCAPFIPIYGGGDASLFNQYKDRILAHPFTFLGEALNERTYQLSVTFENTEISFRKLDRLYLNRKSKWEFELPLQDQFIDPTLELIQILTIRNLIFPKNIRGALALLVTAEAITDVERIGVEKFLLLTLDLRSRFGEQFSTTKLTKQEIKGLLDGYPFLLVLLNAANQYLYPNNYKVF